MPSAVCTAVQQTSMMFVLDVVFTILAPHMSNAATQLGYAHIRSR